MPYISEEHKNPRVISNLVETPGLDSYLFWMGFERLKREENENIPTHLGEVDLSKLKFRKGYINLL